MFKLCENCIRYCNIVLPWESANEKLALKEPIWHSEREYMANKYNITLNVATWLWPFLSSVFTSRQYIVLYMYSFNQTLYIYLLSPSCKSTNDLHYKHKQITVTFLLNSIQKEQLFLKSTIQGLIDNLFIWSTIFSTWWLLYVTTKLLLKTSNCYMFSLINSSICIFFVIW